MRARYRLHRKSQNLNIWHVGSQDDSAEWFFSFFWIFDFYGSYGHFVFFFTIYSLVIWRLAVSELIKLGLWNFVYGHLSWSSTDFLFTFNKKIIWTGHSQWRTRWSINCIPFALETWYLVHGILVLATFIYQKTFVIFSFLSELYPLLCIFNYIFSLSPLCRLLNKSHNLNS